MCGEPAGCVDATCLSCKAAGLTLEQCSQQLYDGKIGHRCENRVCVSSYCGDKCKKCNQIVCHDCEKARGLECISCEYFLCERCAAFCAVCQQPVCEDCLASEHDCCESNNKIASS